MGETRKQKERKIVMRTLRYHGKVVSMDGTMRRYQAIGTQDSKIVFLGTDEEGLAQ